MNSQLTQPQEIMRVVDLLRTLQLLPSSIVFRVNDNPECVVKEHELYRIAENLRKQVESKLGAEGRTVLELRAEAVLWRAYPRNQKDGKQNETLQTLQQNAGRQQVRPEACNVPRVCPTY